MLSLSTHVDTVVFQDLSHKDVMLYNSQLGHLQSGGLIADFSLPRGREVNNGEEG